VQKEEGEFHYFPFAAQPGVIRTTRWSVSVGSLHTSLRSRHRSALDFMAHHYWGKVVVITYQGYNVMLASLFLNHCMQLSDRNQTFSLLLSDSIGCILLS
jgi:hypothetical protein